MQHPPSIFLYLQPSLLSHLPISMETHRSLSSGSLSYSFRCLSFGSESFIEFDPKLLSMRWSNKALEEGSSDSSLDFDSVLLHSVSLDSFKSLLPVSVPVALNPDESMNDDTTSKHEKLRLGFRKFLWILLLKLCKRMRKLKLGVKKEGKASVSGGSGERGRGKRVFDVDTESSIHDAVLHCKTSNLSSLMKEECKD